DGDIGDLGGRWPDTAPREERLDALVRALGLELDAAVGQILHPADQPEPPRLGGGRRAVRHALDTPRNDRADAAHGLTIPRTQQHRRATLPHDGRVRFVAWHA